MHCSGFEYTQLDFHPLMPVCVYRAGNIVDAQLVLDEILAGGMQAHITGSYLSGAVGELPADQLIAVWLDSTAHEQRALDMVRDFEGSRKVTGPDVPCHQCGELLGPQFGRCWQCSAWRS